VLAWYRELIALRHRQADLSDPDLAAVRVVHDAGARWLALRRGDVRVAVNLAEDPAAIPLGIRRARVLAAWDPVEAPGPDGVLNVPGESCVVLTQA
jgi:maltooligosyltrehalose trehalohydrolase